MKALSAYAAVLLLASCGAAPSAPAPVSAGPEPIVFPTLTAGDVTASVKLLSFDRAAMSTVVEPVVFQSGREFCATYGLDPLDRRCAEEYVTESSRTRVTLAVAKDTKLFVTDGIDCVGDDYLGTCPAGLGKLAAQRGRPVRIVVHDATVVRVAVHYQP